MSPMHGKTLAYAAEKMSLLVAKLPERTLRTAADGVRRIRTDAPYGITITSSIKRQPAASGRNACFSPSQLTHGVPLQKGQRLAMHNAIAGAKLVEMLPTFH